LELLYNKPSPGHNAVSDANDLPTNATRNHSRKRGLRQYQEQRKHRSYQASVSHQEVSEMRWVVVEKQVLRAPPSCVLELEPELPLAPVLGLELPLAPVPELELVSGAPVIDYSQSTQKPQETL
jgi:hypothetical protein